MKKDYKFQNHSAIWQFTKSICLLILIFFSTGLSAQVAINISGNAPDTSAMLDVESTDKGLLIPRMTTLQVIAINKPADGLMVYNIDDKRFYFFDALSQEWKEIAIGNSTIKPCGNTLIDARDGQSYNTVQIGTQCWMAENLNIGTVINGDSDQTDDGTIEKYCYNNSISNCDVYGGIYQWNEAMNYTTIESSQGICPDGWHLPSDAEWCTLENYVDDVTVDCYIVGWRGSTAGGNLKETGTSHWASPNYGATNSSGFTNLPGGFRSNTNIFYNLTLGSHIWTSSTYNSNSAFYRISYHSQSQMLRAAQGHDTGSSLRCLQD